MNLDWVVGRARVGCWRCVVIKRGRRINVKKVNILMNLLKEKSAQLRNLGSIGLLSLMMTACGGGGGGGSTDPAPPPPGGPTDTQRVAAATQTASSNAACSASELPEGFYWEIGDRNGAKASGTVSGTDTPTAGQVIAVASS